MTVRVLSYQGEPWSPEEARLLSLHERAANLFLPDGRLVSLVGPELGNGPATAVLERPWRPGEPLCWEGARAWRPEPPPARLAPPSAAAAKTALRELAADVGQAGALSDAASPLGRLMAGGIALLGAHRWAGAVRALAGLTPSGADLLCGYEIALHRLRRREAKALGDAMREVPASASPPLSRHLMRWAARGMAGEHRLTWLDSLLRGEPAPLAPLLDRGATSGVDWAVGALVALIHTQADTRDRIAWQ